jgi:hypothetical protein
MHLLTNRHHNGSIKQIKLFPLSQIFLHYNRIYITKLVPDCNTIVCYVTDPQRQNIDSLTITINNSTTTPSNMRGRFRYTPTAGFVEVGGPVSFGNQFVTLLPQDAGNSPAGSQIIINQADSTVRYIFRWTVLSVYGVRPVNTITHQFVSGSYTSINTVAQTTFAVVQ